MGQAQCFELIRECAARGRLVPFLGAGASLQLGRATLPSGQQLANRLAEKLGLDANDADSSNLLEVTSAAELLVDRMYLEYQLRQVFAAEATPLPIHRCLASEMTPPLIVTTNYDMLMERAFTEARREFHVLMTPFDSAEPAARSVLWWPPGATQPVEAAEPTLFDDGRSVLYKIHGGLDPNGEWHSCVVTEDDYFEIGGRLYNGSLLPNPIGAKLSRSSFLFLGYSLRDPHVRFMLTRLNRWTRDAAHFVVNRHVSRIASLRFNRLGLHVMDMAIDNFVAELARGNAA